MNQDSVTLSIGIIYHHLSYERGAGSWSLSQLVLGFKTELTQINLLLDLILGFADQISVTA